MSSIQISDIGAAFLGGAVAAVAIKVLLVIAKKVAEFFHRIWPSVSFPKLSEGAIINNPSILQLEGSYELDF